MVFPVDFERIEEQFNSCYYGINNHKYTLDKNEVLFSSIRIINDKYCDKTLFMTYFNRNNKLIAIEEIRTYYNIHENDKFLTLEELDKKQVQIDFEEALNEGYITLEQFNMFFTQYDEL